MTLGFWAINPSSFMALIICWKWGCTVLLGCRSRVVAVQAYQISADRRKVQVSYVSKRQNSGVVVSFSSVNRNRSAWGSRSWTSRHWTRKSSLTCHEHISPASQPKCQMPYKKNPYSINLVGFRKEGCDHVYLRHRLALDSMFWKLYLARNLTICDFYFFLAFCFHQNYGTRKQAREIYLQMRQRVTSWLTIQWLASARL